MTEEFDIIGAFQRIRQQLHDTRQPRNHGSIAEALQAPSPVHDNFNFTVPPLPPNLDWRPVRIPEDWQVVYRNTIEQADSYEMPEDLEDDDDEDEDADDGIDIMESMAWAYLPEEIKDDICCKFYHGISDTYQILLTIHDGDQINSMTITAATVKVERDDFGTHLWLNNEVIAWYATNDPLGDEHSPIFFDYTYSKLGTFFLGAAQLLWGAIGYETFIVDSRYIHDDESAPWEAPDNDELSSYVFHQIKQVKQLSGNFGVFKKKVRNARRRRNLY